MREVRSINYAHYAIQINANMIYLYLFEYVHRSHLMFSLISLLGKSIYNVITIL